MEPLAKHEIQTELQPNFRLTILLVIAGIIASIYWTVGEWNERSSNPADLDRTPAWSFEAPAFSSMSAFTRVQDTSFWVKRSNGVLTSSSTVATQNAPAVLSNLVTKAVVVLGPGSVANATAKGIEVFSGTALLTTANKESKLLSPMGALPVLEPRVGTVHDLQTSGRVEFAWPKSVDATGATLDFARDPSFTAILFSQPAGNGTSVSVDFSDRSLGAWFARLRFQEKTLTLTSFNIVESQTPDQLRRLGRRWLAWRDRGLATTYRVEFSENETFKQISQSFQVRNRELDLTQVKPGNHFVRVTAASINGLEYTGRPVALQVQPKEEILRAGLELNDPDLKLFARGWKIVLAPNEVTRIREGYVILRESELRGVKVANEIFKDIPRNQDVKRAEILKSMVFELSRDENFSNPERVRPDAHGELLPPALPLGVLFARLRRVEADGTLGSYGPASRLTTWLPAPIPRKPVPSIVEDLSGVELKWDLATAVAGYELRLSPSREFKAETTTAIRTRGNFRKIASETLQEFFWTVTALNEFGQSVSMTSEVQEVKKPKAPELRVKSTVSRATDKSRLPAMVKPTSPTLLLPAEDAVVVGGATAKKYGKLKWEFASANSFDVQIATDNDFVNVIEKAKTIKPEFTLQGDLPEGALFWRVRKAKGGEWSRSRKFELVYE